MNISHESQSYPKDPPSFDGQDRQLTRDDGNEYHRWFYEPSGAYEIITNTDFRDECIVVSFAPTVAQGITTYLKSLPEARLTDIVSSFAIQLFGVDQESVQVSSHDEGDVNFFPASKLCNGEYGIPAGCNTSVKTALEAFSLAKLSEYGTGGGLAPRMGRVRFGEKGLNVLWTFEYLLPGSIG